MSDEPESFAALLAQARQGDQAAMTQLAQGYEPKIRLVARRRLGPALRPYLDSLDLVNSVHRTLLLGLQQNKFDISSPEKLIALASTLVRRKAAQHWRHLQRQKRLSGAEINLGDLPELLASLSSSPADPAQAAQFHDAVAQLCRHLDATERQVLELHLQGYRTIEVARLLELDYNVLCVRLSRLRQRLRASGVLADLV